MCLGISFVRSAVLVLIKIRLLKVDCRENWVRACRYSIFDTSHDGVYTFPVHSDKFAVPSIPRQTTYGIPPAQVWFYVLFTMFMNAVRRRFTVRLVQRICPSTK